MKKLRKSEKIITSPSHINKRSRLYSKIITKLGKKLRKKNRKKKTWKKSITLPRHYQTLAKCYKLLSKSLENITKPWKKKS